MLRSGRLAAASVGVVAFGVGVLVFVRSAPAATSEGPVTAMDERLAAELARDGIVVQDTSADGVIRPADAVAAARDALPLVADVTATESLVLFTDEVYGPEAASGEVEPLYVERLAWAVVFAGVEVPIMGPVGTGGDTYTANVVVFIDARSGEFLRAIAFPAR